jgi:hypothetical protein
MLLVIMTLLVATNVMGGAIHSSHFSNGRVVPGSIYASGSQPDFSIQIQPSQFLVKNGTSANATVLFMPINGFVGNATLRAYISPSQYSSPSVSFSPTMLELNASLPRAFTCEMVVNTTTTTSLGLYNITATASSGTLSRSANATVGVTHRIVPSNGAELLYKAQFTSIAYAANSTVLESNFEDLGYDSIGITDVTVALDFGSYDSPTTSPMAICVYPGGCTHFASLTIPPYEERTESLTIQIPNNTYTGEHAITVTISWVLAPYSAPYNIQTLVAHGILVVYPRPSNVPNIPPNTLDELAKLLLPILGSIAVIIAVSAVVVIWNRKRWETRDQAMLHDVVAAHQSLTWKRCAGCGTLQPQTASFCGRCGHPFSTANS